MLYLIESEMRGERGASPNWLLFGNVDNDIGMMSYVIPAYSEFLKLQ